MDIEIWAALSGYDDALEGVYDRMRIPTPRRGSAGRIFGEMMPQTPEDCRLFCFRIAPAVERALVNWLPLDEEVADALIRIQRLIRYVLEQDAGGELPGVPLDYEELVLEGRAQNSGAPPVFLAST